MARPSKYETHVEPRLEEIKAWAREGITEEEIAKRLGIAYSTLKEYKNAFSAFSAALKHARAYDEEVVTALHLNTVGQIVKLQKPIKCKKKFFENGKLVREEEVVVTAEEEIYVHPDTMAQMYWLNNRLPTKWKAKPTDNSGEKSAKEALDEIVNAIEGVAQK